MRGMRLLLLALATLARVASWSLPTGRGLSEGDPGCAAACAVGGDNPEGRCDCDYESAETPSCDCDAGYLDSASDCGVDSCNGKCATDEEDPFGRCDCDYESADTPSCDCDAGYLDAGTNPGCQDMYRQSESGIVLQAVLPAFFLLAGATYLVHRLRARRRIVSQRRPPFPRSRPAKNTPALEPAKRAPPQAAPPTKAPAPELAKKAPPMAAPPTNAPAPGLAKKAPPMAAPPASPEPVKTTTSSSSSRIPTGAAAPENAADGASERGMNLVQLVEQIRQQLDIPEQPMMHVVNDACELLGVPRKGGMVVQARACWYALRAPC
jgi:hypothetical protein